MSDLNERLLGLVGESTDARLPSAAQIARLLKVPRKTVLARLHELRRQGILEFSRGTSLWIAGKRGDLLSTPNVRPSQQVYESIVEGISSGLYKPGSRLPKRAFFVSELGFASGTVAVALKRLSEKSIIHKSGGHWVVGRRLTFPKKRAPGVILLVTQIEHPWRNLEWADRTRHFPAEFSREAISNGLQVINVLHGTGRSYPSVVRGPDNSLKYVESLGDRYVGTLLATPDLPVDELRKWLRKFLPLRKPVVWFDPYGTLELRETNSFFTRCSFAEKPGLKKAIDSLVERGHTKIAYINGYQATAWAKARGEELQSIAHGRAELVTVPDYQHIVKQLSDDELRRALLRMHRNGCKITSYSKRLVAAGAMPDTREGHDLSSEAFVEFLVTHKNEIPWGYRNDAEGILDWPIVALTPTFIYAVRKTGCSAILLSNDEMALWFYLWTRMVGIRVPEGTSMLSFDNSSLKIPAPVSSIDFGFGFLGYAAFHLLLGDIPFSVGKDRLLRSRPELVDRGSIADVSPVV